MILTETIRAMRPADSIRIWDFAWAIHYTNGARMMPKASMIRVNRMPDFGWFTIMLEDHSR